MKLVVTRRLMFRCVEGEEAGRGRGGGVASGLYATQTPIRPEVSAADIAHKMSFLSLRDTGRRHLPNLPREDRQHPSFRGQSSVAASQTKGGPWAL